LGRNKYWSLSGGAGTDFKQFHSAKNRCPRSVSRLNSARTASERGVGFAQFQLSIVHTLPRCGLPEGVPELCATFLTMSTGRTRAVVRGNRGPDEFVSLAIQTVLSIPPHAQLSRAVDVERQSEWPRETNSSGPNDLPAHNLPEYDLSRHR